MSMRATTPDRLKGRITGPVDQASGEPAVQLRLSGVTRKFNDVVAVDQIDLDVKRGEIFALLGPSGCGKSTSLRMIAGLEKIDQGSISMRDRSLADAGRGTFLPSEKRNIAMVFQSYAIWPHMTVAQNVAFPLRMRRVKRAERRRRVEEILTVTGLEALADRPATLLSGGQQQRVALARALVYTPDLLLLDEPLSNLDAKLRIQMRREIRRLNRELGITMLFVTHDQDEALSLADRLAVMNKGKVEQVGRPMDLYERPRTAFVRDFLGRLIVVEGVLTGDASRRRVLLGTGGEPAGEIHGPDVPAELADGDRVGVYLRPEDVDIKPAALDGPAPNQVAARVLSSVYLGDSFEYVLDIAGSNVLLSAPRRVVHQPGDLVVVEVDPQRAMVWPL
ncbi:MULTISPECIES: ABC transporter ATP-binding protein [unclassified Streptomyces]|uniref:ABC transporter ATP-binding protein n=1 Tax=unclassified Streptomyces TaxID=2593676 RepID=UPI00081F50ED|nr:MULTISPECIES: ABC transporter ATP-binding protein [unclassified Streptomyces]MYZ35211.1 ATP-binding cassette domain-containing protein [Streptomyces sp. SID4917]SCF73633.1 iron(III) transport system ATP-binding protein [Streptomyces sp. MnatMP-M17]